MSVTLAAASAAAGLAGAGISAAGSYGSMEAQSANAAYQAQVAKNNASIALQNESFDTQAGEVASVNQGMKTRSAVGTTEAQQAASGVSVNTGSAPKVRAAESELGMLDALTIRSNAAKKAYADTVAATSDTAEAGLLEAESNEASEAAPVGALGSFLSSASVVGGNYAKSTTT